MGMGDGEGSEQVRGEDLRRFCRKFDGCIKDPRTCKHLRAYVNGQLSNPPWKSVEPMALEAGIRHLILSMISFYFLAEQTKWFREKKLGLDPLATQTRDRDAARSEPIAA